MYMHIAVLSLSWRLSLSCSVEVVSAITDDWFDLLIAPSLFVRQAYAGQIFTSRLLAAISGEANVVECSFVENTLTPAPFFSTPVSILHCPCQLLLCVSCYGPLQWCGCWPASHRTSPLCF